MSLSPKANQIATTIIRYRKNGVPIQNSSMISITRLDLYTTIGMPGFIKLLSNTTIRKCLQPSSSQINAEVTASPLDADVPNVFQLCPYWHKPLR